ncbi:MAG: hypothetical protein Q9225_007200, partial [Loekoesia sp. 1 TL-2023]
MKVSIMNMQGFNLLEHDNDHPATGNPFTIISDPESNPNADHVIENPDHDAEGGYYFNKIDHIDPERACVFSMKSSIGKGKDLPSDNMVPCIFMPLGWLREYETDKSGLPTQTMKKRTTYYIVLLNLSTDPVSMWLMYDYHILEYDDLGYEYRWTNRLGEYHDEQFIERYGEPAFTSEAHEEFAGFCDSSSHAHQYENFSKRYTNEEHMRPRGPTGDFTHAAGKGDAGGKKWMNIAGDTGYFGLSRAFDLAMLAPNISAWDAENGLDQKQVKMCLGGSHMRLGTSLRARGITKDEEDNFIAGKGNRVDIRDLCF